MMLILESSIIKHFIKIHFLGRIIPDGYCNVSKMGDIHGKKTLFYDRCGTFCRGAGL